MTVTISNDALTPLLVDAYSTGDYSAVESARRTYIGELSTSDRRSLGLGLVGSVTGEIIALPDTDIAKFAEISEQVTALVERTVAALGATRTASRAVDPVTAYARRYRALTAARSALEDEAQNAGVSYDELTTVAASNDDAWDDWGTDEERQKIIARITKATGRGGASKSAPVRSFVAHIEQLVASAVGADVTFDDVRTTPTDAIPDIATVNHKGAIEQRWDTLAAGRAQNANGIAAVLVDDEKVFILA